MAGYPKVARFMASQPEFAIFRSYRALNIQNLLYLQAEIAHLEDELGFIAAEDASREGCDHHAHDWWSLSQGDSEDLTRQWEKWLELREALDRYNDTLLKVSKVMSLEKPRAYDMSFLRSWFVRPTMGDYPLLGLDKNVWDEKFTEDLVGIQARQNLDIFSGWFTETLIPAFHSTIGKRYKAPAAPDESLTVFEYKDALILSIIRVVTTVVASVLPMCSVVVLHNIESETMKLGLVVLFSAVFSFALVIMTNGRTIEVFAATAAFAAVNVVFLNGDGSAERQVESG